jgi:hypothetical protein
MASPSDTATMALFCDFENVALGARDAHFPRFDIRPVLERLLAQGQHRRQEGLLRLGPLQGIQTRPARGQFRADRNPHMSASRARIPPTSAWSSMPSTSATPRDTSTPSSSSAAIPTSRRSSAKLRENAKKVIGVGVKQSCSDLLITNCDEFIYYDDLVREREIRRRR